MASDTQSSKDEEDEGDNNMNDRVTSKRPQSQQNYSHFLFPFFDFEPAAAVDAVAGSFFSFLLRRTAKSMDGGKCQIL